MYNIGFLPTLQPLDDFGRLYAIYGGVFIGLRYAFTTQDSRVFTFVAFCSFMWGAVVDGMKLDKGDLIGSIVALVGVLIVMLWPRQSESEDNQQHLTSNNAL